MRLVSYTFQIDKEVKDKLESISNDEGRSLASQIRVILDDYLEKR